MNRIRTKRGCKVKYNAIIRKLYRDHNGGHFGWDMPTLSICFPNIYKKIQILVRLNKMLPA